jgi:hypothetical protein
MRPAAEAFPELLGPAEEGAQRFQRERRRKGVRELGLAIGENRCQEVHRDPPSGSLECRHPVRAEKRRKGITVSSVDRWVQAVGDRHVPRRATVRVRIGQDIGDILVAEQGPTHELAVRDRASLLHVVVRPALVFLDHGVTRVPIIVNRGAHMTSDCDLS